MGNCLLNAGVQAHETTLLWTDTLMQVQAYDTTPLWTNTLMQVWLTWGDPRFFACRRGELHALLHARVVQVAGVTRLGLAQFGEEGVLEGALGSDALEGVVLQHLTQ